MAESRSGSGLQTLFSVFLGLMLTAFLGVGVYTFYPPPDPGYRPKLEKLERDQQAIRNSRPDDSLSSADRAEMQRLSDERDKLFDESRKAREDWCGKTSIILVSLATLVMVVSLTVTARLPVISSGLLMGGVFTMLYGVGWVIASGTSTMRFVVMTFALAITLMLGYLRFVRRRATAVATGDAPAPVSSDFSDLESRIRNLEEQVASAADALGGRK
jgi:hypothetical protein